MATTNEILKKGVKEGVDPIAILLVVEVLKTLEGDTVIPELLKDIPLKYLESVHETLDWPSMVDVWH